MRIFVPVLLDTVWDGEGVRSCRAAALPSPLRYISHTHPKLVSYSKCSFPKADHDLLCSLRGNSLIYRNCSSETPATIAYASEPGATTCTRRMYLQAVLGRFQNARCMMVVRSSPASACDMAPPERKECMENSFRSPAEAAEALRDRVIWAAESGEFPRRGLVFPLLSVIVGNKYPLVMSHPNAEPILIYYFTARTGQIAKDWPSYATVSR